MTIGLWGSISTALEGLDVRVSTLVRHKAESALSLLSGATACRSTLPIPLSIDEILPGLVSPLACAGLSPDNLVPEVTPCTPVVPLAGLDWSICWPPEKDILR